MIYKEERIVVNFEGGNIEVVGSYHGKIGLVKFAELEHTQEIGTKVESNNEYFPVIMAFHKPESIDVVIKALNHAKKKMMESEDKQ